MAERVDIAIPVYRPGAEFAGVIKMLESQDIRPQKIIIINTKDNEADPDTDLTFGYDNIEVYRISKEEFDHGRTRNEAASHSDSPYLVFMTMDAVPADTRLISELLKPMSDERVAVSYARQLPKEDCSTLERINRQYNYPDGDVRKGKEDIERFGVKTFFCSNACACYRKEIFDSLGGFVNKTLFNEDMIYASKAVRAGFCIYYASSAKVYHSHNYTLSGQYHRNFDLGVSQAEHPEVFEGISSENEGMKFVNTAIKALAAERELYLLPKFLLFCAARFLGFKKGKKYEKMSEKAVLKATTDPGYFLRKRGK